MIRISDLPTPAESIRGELAHGNRQNAARIAKHALESGHTTKDELRAIVEALADGLNDAGDEHEGRGRPRREWNMKRDGRIALANGTYAMAIRARLLVDGDDMDAEELAWLMWGLNLRSGSVPECSLFPEEWIPRHAEVIAENLDEARQALIPAARAELRRLKLTHVPRRGFRGVFKRRIAERFGCSVHAVARR